MCFRYITAHTDTEGESEDERRWLSSTTSILMPEDKIELLHLLQQVDRMHCGSESDKSEGFRLLLENEGKVLRVHAILTLFLCAIYKFSAVYEFNAV